MQQGVPKQYGLVQLLPRLLLNSRSQRVSIEAPPLVNAIDVQVEYSHGSDPGCAAKRLGIILKWINIAMLIIFQ